MLDAKVAELLNTQINKEFYSAYLYMDFSYFYVEQGLDGFATLDAIDKPDKVFAKYDDPLHAGYEHEQYVTGLIHTIYDAAHEVKDYRTMQFLDWFVKEQGEEETNAEGLIKKYELFGSDARALYMLDNELAGRVYSAPSLVL